MFENLQDIHKCVCVCNIRICMYMYDPAVRDICVLTFENLQYIHKCVCVCNIHIYIYIYDQAVRDICVLTFENLQDIHTNVCACVIYIHVRPSSSWHMCADFQELARYTHKCVRVYIGVCIRVCLYVCVRICLTIHSVPTIHPRWSFATYTYQRGFIVGTEWVVRHRQEHTW